MTKTEYMEELQKKLRKLPKEDYQKAIDYYEEYFADAGQENETQAIEDLGSPQEAADQIVRAFAIDNVSQGEAKKDVRKGFSEVWVVILAICASPIALPILIAVVAMLFAFGLMIVALLFAFGLAGIALLLSAVFAFVGSFVAVTQNIPAALICVGLGCSFTASGVLITYGSYLALRKFLYKTVVLFGKMIARGEKKHEKK